MILSYQNILSHLLSRGLVSLADVVAGDVLVLDASSRNRNFKVINQAGESYFLKQAQAHESSQVDLLHREAAFYDGVQHDEAYASLATLLPRLIDFDPWLNMLTLSLIPNSQNLRHHHQRFPLSTAIASEVGRCLARCHIPRTRIPSKTFPQNVPSIFWAHEQPLPSAKMGEGVKQVIGIIREYEAFHPFLTAARAEWQGNTLIHGDIKWDNIVVNPDDSICFIDWETADIGDAAWDIGAVFQAYLLVWIMSVPMADDSSSGERQPTPTHALRGWQPAMRAFWHSYLQHATLQEEAASLLLRSVSYSGVRLLQTACEYTYQASHMTRQVLAILQVSLNILADPQTAMQQLWEL